LGQTRNYILENMGCGIFINGILNTTIHEKIQNIQNTFPYFSRFILMNIDIFGS
jgi:hypothetical protein